MAGWGERGRVETGEEDRSGVGEKIMEASGKKIEREKAEGTGEGGGMM